MKKHHKIILIFSIIYWFIITVGLILTGLAFEKVPIGYYGIKVNYFSPNIDENYYTNGLYHKGIGNYFILYPSTKKYIQNVKLTLTTKDLQRLQLTYTICYRILPNKLINLYKELALNYEQRVIAIINNIISTYVNKQNQNTILTNLQSQIINSFNNKIIQQNGFKISQTLNNAITIQAIWINKINFFQTEQYYDKAFIYSTSASENYQSASYNLTLSKLQINSLNSLIQSKKLGFLKEMQANAKSIFNNQMQNTLETKQQQILLISSLYTISKAFKVSLYINLINNFLVLLKSKIYIQLILFYFIAIKGGLIKFIQSNYNIFLKKLYQFIQYLKFIKIKLLY